MPTSPPAPGAAEPSGLWQALAEPAREDGPPVAAVDVWAALDDHLDLGAYVPTPTAGVELRAVEGRGGSRHWVLRSPAHQYVRLDEIDLDLWRRMDGQRTVRQIAFEHFVERGGFVAERVARLVRGLRAGGFLGTVPTDAFEATERRLRLAAPLARVSQLAGGYLTLTLARLPWTDRWFAAAYAGPGWLLYTRLARWLWAVIIVAGLAAWWTQVLRAEHALFQTNGSYTLGLVTLAVLDVAGVALYQIAQGLTMKRHGCRVFDAGLQVYYGLPIVYVDTTDAWMAGRRDRMAVSLSGPVAMLVLGGGLALLAFPLDGTEMGAFLFKGAFVWLTNGLFNLLPILELDGYFLLVDYLEMPALRANALAFVRQGLLPRLRARLPLTREERIYTAYGLGYGLLVALIPVAIFEARDLRYASSLAELWNRPDPGGQLLAAGSAVLLLGPAVFALLNRIARALLALSRLGYRRWQQARGQVPREHLEALASLPFLADVPRPELRLMARHLSVEEAEPGEVIVRQGAPGDRFYIIREGQVRVVRLTSDGREERLATLGSGDYFGETALVARVPRTATVVAEAQTRLFSLDAGHFRRWLASRVDVDAAVRHTLAERGRLAGLPLFAGVGSAELDRLAARMLVTRYSAGDAMVVQGQPGDRFYVLMDGRAEVARREADGDETVVAELGVGDFFGEMALLDGRERSATVRALTPVETYTLSAEDFHELLGRLPAVERVRETARRRARELARGGSGSSGAGPSSLGAIASGTPAPP